MFWSCRDILTTVLCLVNYFWTFGSSGWCRLYTFIMVNSPGISIRWLASQSTSKASAEPEARTLCKAKSRCWASKTTSIQRSLPSLVALRNPLPPPGCWTARQRSREVHRQHWRPTTVNGSQRWFPRVNFETHAPKTMSKISEGIVTGLKIRGLGSWMYILRGNLEEKSYNHRCA